MEYIIQNWHQLSIIDRGWFVGGAWLLTFFIVTVFYKVFRKVSKNHQNH